MTVPKEDYVAWLAQADIPAQRRTSQLDVLLESVFRFRQQQGNDYYSTRLLSHFLLHCDCGLKVAQIARLVGIARPTASKQQGMSAKAAIRQAHHRMAGRSHGKLLPRYAGPIAAFLLGHPKASQAELIEFVAQTFGERVSRIALYKFLKKYGLTDVSDPPQPPALAHPGADAETDPPLESPTATEVAPTPAGLPVPLLASTLIAAPTPVIELARAINPSQPSPPPFSSGGRNLPGPSC
jgi:hypothetical protein